MNSLWEKGNARQEGETVDLSINLDAGRLRWRCAADGCGQVRGVAVRHLRRAVHHPAHPHHSGQLQQVGDGVQWYYLVSSTGPGGQNTHQQISHKLLGLCLYPRPKLCFVIKSWRTFPVKTIVYYWCCRLFHALDVCCCLFQLSFQFLLILFFILNARLKISYFLCRV